MVSVWSLVCGRFTTLQKGRTCWLNWLLVALIISCFLWSLVRLLLTNKSFWKYGKCLLRFNPRGKLGSSGRRSPLMMTWSSSSTVLKQLQRHNGKPVVHFWTQTSETIMQQLHNLCIIRYCKENTQCQSNLTLQLKRVHRIFAMTEQYSFFKLNL